MGPFDFTITGRIDGREASIRWNDGELSGDEVALTRLRELAERAEGKEVGVPEWWTSVTDHLSNPVATIKLIERLFNRQVTYTGTIPIAPPHFG